MADQKVNNDTPSNIEETIQLENNESLTEKALARRQLLKVLAATGAGLTAAAFVPEKWVKPVMKGGVLPAHAQTSPIDPATATSIPTNTPTAMPTNTPTATPIIYAITTCNAQNASGPTIISTTDTISTFAIITPNTAGIQLRRRIILNQAGHAQDGQDLDNSTGATDASGQFTPANFDLSTVAGLTAGTDRISVRWDFVNASDGTNVCVNLLTLMDAPN